MTDAHDCPPPELAPLDSLLSKSTKARERLAPGTWQHDMLTRNIEALHIARALLMRDCPELAEQPADEPRMFDTQELARAATAIDSMIDRTRGTQAKFAAGTSQHTLQRNRLAMLEAARSAVEAQRAALDR